MTLLQKLDKEDLRFGELFSTVGVARGTLSTRIKEAKEMGLIHKTIREDNGEPVWSLTDDGRRLRYKLKPHEF